MSELINNTNLRVNDLFQFSKRLMNGENGNFLIKEYQNVIDTVSAIETMQVLDRLLKEGYPFEMVKSNVGKIINVFYKSLSLRSWEKPGENHFLYHMMLENRKVEQVMKDIRSVTRAIFKSDIADETSHLTKLGKSLEKLKEYDLHYVKKENILFPCLEKTFLQHNCLKLMWSFHDDFRRSLKVLESLLVNKKPDKQLLNKELGKLFFVVFPIIFREEQIVFPVAMRVIQDKMWVEMVEQSLDTGWAYGAEPSLTTSTGKIADYLNGSINLGTGLINPEQLILMLNNLPVDITFVDENDEVVYFSGTKHRIFPRSKAIIGRKVQNCHPSESVHIVNEIIEAFRIRAKDNADFWIQVKNRFIYIRYFALINERGEYKGTIEVSQDVTDIRTLNGEKRLLEWNK